MQPISEHMLTYGSDAPLPEQTELRAGPVTLIYEGGSIRNIRLGNTLILHSIYSAVRDENWGTIAGRLTIHEFDVGQDSFRIEYVSEHKKGDIDFVWTGSLRGDSDGTVVFEMNGEARSTFRRNRIGFCVLHPMNVAGQDCTILHVDGTQTEGQFPRYISPHQPFKDIRAIRHEVIPGVIAEVMMEGDTFEMEDQRNWTDASFKTYCTPLGLLFPVTVRAGDSVAQRITLTVAGTTPSASQRSDDLRVVVGDESVPLPAIGLSAASHGQPLSERELARLKRLNLAHLRVDLDLQQESVASKLAQAADEARALGVPLEIALHLTTDADAQLEQFLRSLDAARPQVARWIVFDKQALSTPGATIELARHFLNRYVPDIPVGAGTDAFFTQVNRNRPPIDAIDFVSFSVNPQVHAFDNLSLVETLPVQGANVESAQQFSGGKPIVVSPITLKMRWNPDATSAPKPPAPGELPGQVDPRQMSLFTAGWTLGSIKYLAQSGASSTTYFETSGWLGVMETEQGSPLPDKFPSIPGAVYPVYHVLADIGECAGGSVVSAVSSDQTRVDALVLRRPDGGTRVLLANHTAQPQDVDIQGLDGEFSTRTLDTTNGLQAMKEPETFRAQAGRTLAAVGGLHLTITPFAVVTLDSIPR